MSDRKPDTKERILVGLVYAVVGTILVQVIQYFRGMGFNGVNALISFVLFWVFGYVIYKRNDKKRLE